MSNKNRSKYPEEFLEICSWVNEKVVKEKNILHFEEVEKRQSQMLIIGIILLMLFIIYVFRDRVVNIGAIFVLVFAVLGLVLYTILSNLKILKIKVDVKRRVLEEFAIHIRDGFVYESSGEISESKYRKSGFNKNYNEFTSNCFMAGDREGKNMGIANVEVKKRIVDKDNKNKKEILKTIFKGVFTYIDLKEFTQEIDLMSTDSNNNVKDKISFDKDNLYIYTEDKEYALSVFDSDILDRIRDMKKEFNTNIELMVNKQMLYIRFFMTDMDNTLLFASNNEKKLLYKYYRMINETYDLSEKIDENIMKCKTNKNI